MAEMTNMPYEIYLKQYYKEGFNINGIKYEYSMYVTTTFGSRLYKYLRT
jgi:hypothetical protein